MYHYQSNLERSNEAYLAVLFVTPFSVRIMKKVMLYVRKSLDRSDRQVASIDSQIAEMTKTAKRLGLVIVDVLIEQKSAKKPGRPVFNQLIERIQNGEAQGILCWKLNRLARNPVDAGTISWLLQGNIIQAIYSKERTYLPSDNVLMMQIDFGIANQFIKDLSSDTNRGLRDKARNGWMPQSSLPIGYLHHPKKQNARKQIICDPARFPIIKELWKLMLSGAYSVMDIKRVADQMGLVNPKGKSYALNTFHLLFKNPMYYGKFYWKDEHGNRVLYQGKHQAVVSEEQFRTVQDIIHEKYRNANRHRKHTFTYRGLLSCGECKGYVTAERKYQAICAACKHKYSIVSNEVCRNCKTPLSKMIDPTIIDITYYRCTKKKHKDCSQKAITEEMIEHQLEQALKDISIPQGIYEFATQHIASYIRDQHKDDEPLLDSLRKKKERVNAKLHKLIDMQLSGDIPRERADQVRIGYEKELEQIERSIFKKENAQSISLYESTSYLEYAQNCLERFKSGDQKTKKELIGFLCSNLTIRDKTLYFSTKKAPQVLDSLRNHLYSYSGGSNVKLCEYIRVLG